jgi:hypothetical protein
VHRDATQRYQSAAEAMRALYETDVVGARSVASSMALPPSPSLALEVALKNRTVSAEAVTLQDARTPPALHRTLPTAHPPSNPGAPKSRRGPLLGLAALGIGGLAALWLMTSNGHDPAPDPSLIPSKDEASSPRSPAVSTVGPSVLPKTDTAATALSAVNAAGPEVPRLPSAEPVPSAQRAVVNRRPASRPVATTPKRRPGKAEDDVYGDR